MEHGLDCIEYDEWKEFYRQEPWGCAVDDDRAAKGINYLIAVNSASDHKWIPTHHLFPRREADFKRAQEEQKQLTAEDELAFGLRALLHSHNARVEAAEQPEQLPLP